MQPPKPRKPHHVTPETQADKDRREAELAKALGANLRRRKAGAAAGGKEEGE